MLRTKLTELLNVTRNGLLYDDDKGSLKERMLSLFVKLNSLLEETEPAGPVPMRAINNARFCVILQNVANMGERKIFFIDGYITESTLLAIKKLRQVDNIGLKEAKDYIDCLKARAVFPERL